MQHPGRWWIGLVPLVVVWIAANLVEGGPIERDLGERATAALPPDGEIERAAARVAGRDVTLTGTSASAGAGTALAAKVDALDGVRLVRTAFAAPLAVKPYAFSARREGGDIVLSGSVPSQDARARLLAAAAAPGRHVVDHLRLASGEPGNFDALAAWGIAAAGKLEGGDFSTADAGYRLSGAAGSGSDYEAVAAAKPPAGAEAKDVRIEPPLARPFEWQAARSADTITLSGVAPSAAARDAIRAKTAALFPNIKVADTMGVARGAPPGDFAGIAGHALGALAKLDGGGATIHDAAVTVSGTAHDADDIPAIDRDLHAALPKPYALALLRLQPPVAAPYTFKAERDGGTVHLTGHAPDAAARQRLVAAAKAQFPDAQVRDDLKLAGGAPDGFADAVAGAIPALARLGKATLAVSDGKAEVGGEAPYAKAADEVRAALASSSGGGLAITANIGVVPPAPPLDAAACQPTFADLLTKGHIEFETGSAVLSKASTPLLDGLVVIAQRCRSASIEVAGHTDTVGQAEANLELSRRRAQAVVDYFAAAGLDTARITSTGFGQDRPIASNDTADGRTRNRRIEFLVK